MRVAWPGLLIFLVLLGGCSTSPSKNLPTHPAVDALVIECRSHYCPDALPFAEEVIRKGVETLPALEAAWKWTTDPDAMVWTRACLECLKGHLTLEQYREGLRRQMHQGDPPAATRAATQLYVLGEQDGYEYIQLRGIQLAERLILDIDSLSIENVNGKRRPVPFRVRALGSAREGVATQNYAMLIEFLHIPYAGRWDELSPEKKQAFMDACTAAWASMRVEEEAKWSKAWQNIHYGRDPVRRLFE